MAKREGGANINVAGIQRMESNMESPMNAQKDTAEAGPAAPKGLPVFEPGDPLRICPGVQGAVSKSGRPE